jgi:phage terminase small subunit
MPNKKLTHKQEKFCVEYLVDLNATQAAIRAGYSVKTAKQMGSENLTKPDLQKRLTELGEKVNARAYEDEHIADIDEALRDCTREMRFNLKGLYDKNSALLAINEMDDEITTSLRMTPAGITSPDKVRSREQLLKVLGAIPHNGNGKKNGDTNIENVQININTEPVRRALEDVK